MSEEKTVKEFTLDEYQEISSRTMPVKRITDVDNDTEVPAVKEMFFGVWSECGELADVVKKIETHSDFAQTGVLQDKHRAKIIEEVGDCFWYQNAYGTMFDFKISELVDLDEPNGREVKINPMEWVCDLTEIGLATRRAAISCAVLPSYENLRAVKDRIRDMHWRTRVLCAYYSIPWREALSANYEKLQNKVNGRYKDGFSNEASINRTQ